MSQYRGVVKWFNNTVGDRPTKVEEGKELFLHSGAMAANGHRGRAEGKPAHFEVVEGSSSGLQADQVKRRRKD